MIETHVMLSYQSLLLALACSVGAVLLSTLERDVTRLESVREIKDIQKSFAQYAQFGQWREMAELFVEDGIVHWGRGAPLDDEDADIVRGPDEIEAWLKADAGNMNGVRPGSFNAHLNEMPLVSLSEDGSTAKTRWQVLRLMGDGAGKTRVQAGVYENEYVQVAGEGGDGGHWQISLLRYYPMTEGDFSGGWDNVGSGERLLPIIPYHFTPDEAGMPIPLYESSVKLDNYDEVRDYEDSDEGGHDDNGETDIDILAHRISQLNDEDEVRNLQHAYGYYVDQRMWTDVLDLCTEDASMIIDGAAHSKPEEIRSALEEWMGPENLTEGILNEHPMFDVMVKINYEGTEATARGLEMGLIGDMSERQSSWRFNVFRNTFVKDAYSGIWKIKTLEYTRLIDAGYQQGWGGGGDVPTGAGPLEPPEFISRTWRNHSVPDGYAPPTGLFVPRDDVLGYLTDRFSQSASFDESENVGSAYGYFADDIRCQHFADLHAEKGFKESPGAGWYYTRERIAQACLARYRTFDPDPQRPRVPFHWRLQPVVIPSNDGRSASMRTRLLQFGTSNEDMAGFRGLQGFNGGMYHDQFVLEETSEGTLRRKLWCLTIDEFYWQTPEWEEGWIAPELEKRGLLLRQSRDDYPPDVPLTDPLLGDREMGLPGGPIEPISYPEILTMWFAYRNPVSGRIPDAYWAPGCVPCRGPRPEWALRENGYQEPPTGPTLVSAISDGSGVIVKVTAGPEEEVSGVVELRGRGGKQREWSVLESGDLDDDGKAIIELTLEKRGLGDEELAVVYLGNDNIKPGGAKVLVE
ncbi:hypothetical protein VUR80DRAFT_2374 [Thermomyces stellatus]